MSRVLNEDTYDEINAELRQMAAIAAAEQEPDTPKKNIGSGEDSGILFFQWKDIEHYGDCC